MNDFTPMVRNKHLTYYTAPGMVTQSLLVKLSKDFEAGLEEIITGGREENLVAARYCLFWYLHRREKVPYLQLEKKTGMDHATIRHGVLRLESTLRDPRTWESYGPKMAEFVQHAGMFRLSQPEKALIYELFRKRKEIY